MSINIKIVFVLCFVQLLFIFALIKQQKYYNTKIKNIANTVSPIIDHYCETVGNAGYGKDGYTTVNTTLIYKREPTKGIIQNASCISEIGNVYYARRYIWDREEITGKTWIYPFEDVPLGCFSCIDEKNIDYLYLDQDLQNAKLGVKIYRK